LQYAPGDRRTAVEFRAVRGPNYNIAQSRRGGHSPQPQNQADAQTYLLPAPTGGWNSSSSLASMPETDALVLDNLFPAVGEINFRKGFTEWATGITGFVHTLIIYTGPTASKMFAASDDGIWEVSVSGAVGAIATACTDGDWQYENITTSGGNYLLAVNGVDLAKRYDGTTWAATGITGVTLSDLINIKLFKRRLWFVEKDTLDAWYLDADAISGAATLFPFGPVFPKGGSLVAQYVWTIDGGVGLDDYLVSVTSEGELAVYQGTDPDDPDLFSLVGTYDVGKPLGRRCFMKYGGDVLYLSQRGVFPLSKLLVSDTQGSIAALSAKIDEAYRAAAALYGTSEGWESTIYPELNAIFINVPSTTDSAYQQFVMNTITKAWCRFSEWNFHTLVMFNNVLYGGGDAGVFQLWNGSTDNGELITGTVGQAYNILGSRTQKEVKLVRPIIRVSGTATILLRMDGDFKEMLDTSTFSYNSDGTIAIWDLAQWDLALWETEATDIESSWTAIPSFPAYMHSFHMQITSGSINLDWLATYFAHSRAGIL
jgi:hypothetical protein